MNGKGTRVCRVFPDIIPRNPIFVVSADHPSAVMDIFPGVDYSMLWLSICMSLTLTLCGWLTIMSSTTSYAQQIDCEDGL